MTPVTVTVRELLALIAALVVLGWLQTWITCWIGMLLVRRYSAPRPRPDLRRLAEEIDALHEEDDNRPENAGRVLP